MELQIKRDPVTGIYYYEEVREVEADTEEEIEAPPVEEPVKRGRPKKR